MEWDELDLEAVQPGQDEAVPEETETEEPDQETDDPVEDAAEESGEETADSNSEESDEEEASDLEEDEAGMEEDASEEIQQSSDVITISGNAIIFPEEYDLASFASGTEDESVVVQAIEEQTVHLQFGLLTVVFFLGVIAGLLFAQCFRLRRV